MTIHKSTDDETGEISYLISAQHIWRPGGYESERAARYATQFRDEQLRALQDQVSPGVITFTMLQALKRATATPPPKALTRMFGWQTAPGRFCIGREITTNASHTTLSELHALTRKRFIEYTDAPEYMRVFGVRAWNVKLTDAGFEAMKVWLASKAQVTT